jgi:hypothetical protein
MAVPFSRRLLPPCAAPKLNPAIWITSPTRALDGQTPSTRGRAVQSPRSCHPLDCPLTPIAARSSCFAPLYPAAKVTGTLTVQVFPLGEAPAVSVCTVHWLFWSVGPAPIVPVIHAVPASLSSDRAWVAVVDATTQELAALAPVASTQSQPCAISLAPAALEYSSVNVWVGPPRRTGGRSIVTSSSPQTRRWLPAGGFASPRRRT